MSVFLFNLLMKEEGEVFVVPVFNDVRSHAPKDLLLSFFLIGHVYALVKPLTKIRVERGIVCMVPNCIQPQLGLHCIHRFLWKFRREPDYIRE